MTITEAFAKHNSDKGTAHSYLPVYERLLEPIKNKIFRLLEIGVQSGYSLKSWHDWLGDMVYIYGIDNGADCGMWASTNNRIVVLKADQTKPDSLFDSLNWLSDFDIIIDDGLHHPYAQIVSYGTLWPKLTEGGIYFIEDVQSIEVANNIASMFNFNVEDLRAVKGRDDDILLWKRKESK